MCIRPLGLAALGLSSARCHPGALRSMPGPRWQLVASAASASQAAAPPCHCTPPASRPGSSPTHHVPLMPAGSALQGPRAASQLHGSGPALGSSGAIRDGLVAVRPLDGAQRACDQSGWLSTCPTAATCGALAQDQAHAPHCTLHRCACTPRQLVPAGVSTASLPRARIQARTISIARTSPASAGHRARQRWPQRCTGAPGRTAREPPFAPLPPAMHSQMMESAQTPTPAPESP